MALVTKPNTTTNGTLADGSQVESNFNTIYNDYNGNITNANIAASAAIVDTKLAQIATASKVSGAALTALASIPSAGGYIPVNNLGAGITRFKVGTFSKSAASSGTQLITGVGFEPIAVIFAMGDTGGAMGKLSVGFDDGSSHIALFDYSGVTTGNYRIWSSESVTYYRSGADAFGGSIQSLDADGFTMTWTKSGTGTYNGLEVGYLAMGRL